MKRLLLLGIGLVCRAAWAADFDDPQADREALPEVPAGFEVSFFAREPMVRQPCSMAFDDRGRLCIGMGPQYRSPKPETPGDSVVLVLDDDGDGRADRTRVFATGFNAIQGLAWHGRDLWVANTPDLTVVRDLDGDDEADEYVRVYTDLGNLEHGLHGLNWAPDGKLYMSKGNSKGLTQPGRVAPKPFRDLWGVSAPAGTPDFPPPRTFRKGEYRHAYHDPDDDWGREGGVLRCDDGGANLEIISRGSRNPWDIAFDSGFNWLGTDNDQNGGDRVFMPFFGAHFGWNHPWSAHWGTDVHAPTAPVSGPLFEGSGTGVVFGDSPQFPAAYRGVFFVDDWLRKTTFVWRPRWDGALLRSSGDDWEPFIRGGKSLFRPTDLEFGPDGALWVLGWSAGYGAEYRDGQVSSEGRVFRIVAKGASPARAARPSRRVGGWTAGELIADLDSPLPIWRINAQDELVRRGADVKAALQDALDVLGAGETRQTWCAWALGRMTPQDTGLDRWFASAARDAARSLNLRVQAVRILAHRQAGRVGGGELFNLATRLLGDGEPRLRFEAVQAIRRAGLREAAPSIAGLLASERDRVTYYAGWQALRALQPIAELRRLLTDERPGVRRGALLALLEDHSLQESEVRVLASDRDPSVREIAELWQTKSSAGGETAQLRGRPLDAATAGAGESVPPVGLARNIRSRSGAVYPLVPAGLRAGALPYTDRRYDLKQVPESLAGLDFIRTANDDEASRGNGFVVFEALMPVRVLVAVDARQKQVPAWLREKYRRDARRIRADHWEFELWSREFPAGPVELGGNTDDGAVGGKGNYIVVLEPIAMPPPANPTSMDAALSALNRGDVERGRWLFHARGGVGCYNCHRLENHGNGFGPDLALLGERATARHVVQSILEPNAVITEGFALQIVETADAEYSGVLLEESGLGITLGFADGQRRVIPRSQITARRSASISAMPAFDAALSDVQVADLSAYLLSLKGAAASPAVRTGTGGVFTAGMESDRLVISHKGRRVADFVFRDERILRPYLANLLAPSGAPVTRHHPPRQGIDAVDHDTMHPGVWFGFGDLAGADFWRNKGRMEHVRFVVEPREQSGRLEFATESLLRDPAGRVVCTLTNRLRIGPVAGAWLVDWEASFHSEAADFAFGDQEEMGFGARVATPLTEKSGGLIRSSAGLTTAKATWGKPADWCDYSGVIDGVSVGICLMADPGNFRPSWWHNRDYGVFVANPFGRGAMQQGAKSSVLVRRGETFRLRFGAAIHSGPDWDPATAYREFVGAR